MDNKKQKKTITASRGWPSGGIMKDNGSVGYDDAWNKE